VSDTKHHPSVQGEGDYRSARRHRRDLEEFVDENDVEQLARDAAPRSEAEQREMLEAEREGRSRARGRKPGNRPSEK
jgi:hypothetical protein